MPPKLSNLTWPLAISQAPIGKLDRQSSAFAGKQPDGPLNGICQPQPPAGGLDGRGIANLGLNLDNVRHEIPPAQYGLVGRERRVMVRITRPNRWLTLPAASDSLAMEWPAGLFPAVANAG
jgi:hypothetical protein